MPPATAACSRSIILQGFFSSLRSEELPHGVRCLIAAPSFVATNIGNAAPAPDGTVRPGSAVDGIDYMSAQDAAAIILRGLEKEQAFIPVGRVARMAAWLMRASPALYERAMRRKTGGG